MSSEERTTNVIQKHAQPISVTLTKGAKGTYRWEISVKAETTEKALRLIAYTDLELRKAYGGSGSALKPVNPHIDHWQPREGGEHV